MFYSILFCSVQFCFLLFNSICSILFFSVVLYCIVLYSALFCSVLFHLYYYNQEDDTITWFYYILIYSILFYPILLYCILFCSRLFCLILFYSILFCSVLFSFLLFYYSSILSDSFMLLCHILYHVCSLYICKCHYYPFSVSVFPLSLFSPLKWQMALCRISCCISHFQSIVLYYSYYFSGEISWVEFHFSKF